MRPISRKERRRRIRHQRKLYRIEERAAKQKNKVSGRFMNRVVICMIEDEPEHHEEVQG